MIILGLISLHFLAMYLILFIAPVSLLTCIIEIKSVVSVRENKKWGGVLVIFLKDFEDKTNRYFKTLITCAEASNNNFKFDWSKPECLKDKKIGIVFREEDFEDTEGNIRTAVKPFRACVYDKTEETKIPNKKGLPEKGDSFESFVNEQSDSGDGLPF